MGRQRSKRASSADMPEEDDVLSPISCEVCRQRKCKCDRRLPHCTQCSNESSKCKYPESGKRGLPLGYLNQLEQRLAETESALYGALMTLSSMGPTTTLLQATTKPDSLQKSKAARMDEWSRLPLRGWPDIYHWKASMCEQFTLNRSQEVPLVNHSTASQAISASPASTTIHSHSPQGELETSGPASFAWHPGEDVNMSSPYNVYLRPPGMVSSPVYSRDPAPGPAETIVNPFPDFSTATVTGNSGKEDEHSTMADELSKSKPSIYF
ncbi:Zn(II)2Cys6 transcription factor domain-containing protein [Aspergillus tubingensis]|uniref:Zn(II)2Cys6 transcription factor domain-containing protein n=1 Tax=Aspergillus tubingensis TaxID=5068 RepID=UPI001578C962|nr:cytochrome P450 family protein [Aspergillus tubingensis]GFN11779.1 cytochrome P450 family protein [Aspergillus tubingensis]